MEELQNKVNELERELDTYKKKVDDLYSPIGLPESIIESLIRRGFMRVDTILRYNNSSGLEFRTLFITHNDKNTALTGFDKSYYVEFTASTSDTCTANGHSLSNDDRLYVISTGTLPSGLDNTIQYYVINAATNTFKLSLTSGGAAVNITSVGSGTHYFQQQ